MKKKRLIFWLRLIAHFLIGTGIPIAFTLTRKIPNSKAPGQFVFIYQSLVSTNETKISMWVMVMSLIIIVPIVGYLKDYYKSLNTFTMSKQIIAGVLKTIVPLIITFLMFWQLEQFFSVMKEIILVLIIAKAAVIAINPMPRYVFEKKNKEYYGSAFEEMIKNTYERIFKKD